MAQNLHSTFETGALQLCPITEIAAESAFIYEAVCGIASVPTQELIGMVCT